MSGLLQLRPLAHAVLHQFEVRQRRSEIASKSEGFDQLFTALLVLAHLQQNDSKIVMSRGRIRGKLKLFEGGLRISAARQKHAEIVVARRRFRIQLQGSAEFV